MDAPLGTETAPPVSAVDWTPFPDGSWPFFLIALALSLLVGIAEVAGAFRDRPTVVRALLSRWAWLYYGIYLLLTFLIGRILLEYRVVAPGWASAVVLGLVGPSLLKTQIKLFKPLTGTDGLTANLERVLQGVQQFCFQRINEELGHRRIDQMLSLAQREESVLEQWLQLLYGDTEYHDRLQPLLKERREEDAASVRPLILALIEQKDPAALERLGQEPNESRGISNHPH